MGMRARKSDERQPRGGTPAADRLAFADLYRLFADRVYTHCMRRLWSAQDAEDVTAQVFAETWARRHVIEATGDEMLPWLLGTANNLIRSHVRVEVRLRRSMLQVLDPETEPDAAELIVDRASEREALIEIHQVLDKLHPDDRDVIWMCVIEGLSPSDVAKQMNMPSGTVRSRLHRALKRARSLYASSAKERFDHEVLR